MTLPAALTTDLKHALYEVSQGITAFAVKAFLLAQIRAIATKQETITEELIYSVAQDEFRIANPILTALRNNEVDKLANIDDVLVIDVGARLGKAQAALAGVSSAVSLLELPNLPTDKLDQTSTASALAPLTGEPTGLLASKPEQPKPSGKTSTPQSPKRKSAGKRNTAQSAQAGLLGSSAQPGKLAGYEVVKKAGYISAVFDHEAEGAGKI